MRGYFFALNVSTVLTLANPCVDGCFGVHLHRLANRRTSAAGIFYSYHISRPSFPASKRKPTGDVVPSTSFVSDRSGSARPNTAWILGCSGIVVFFLHPIPDGVVRHERGYEENRSKLERVEWTSTCERSGPLISLFSLRATAAPASTSVPASGIVQLVPHNYSDCARSVPENSLV